MVCKIVCQLSYHGGVASGWQEQPEEVSIAGEIKKALFQLTDQEIGLACAGRTDKGVHAVGQILSFDAPDSRAIHKWQTGLNHYLPSYIRVQAVTKANLDFHPRFAALARTYRYYCQQARHPLTGGLITLIHKKPDLERLNKAAQMLLGTHNFSAFRGGSCQAKSPIKNCMEAFWREHGQLLCFQIKADAFLHHMVRYLVGCMLEVGYGHKSLTWFEALIKNHETQAICAPPEGLYFCHAHYPDRWNLPFIDQYPWFDPVGFAFS